MQPRFSVHLLNEPIPGRRHRPLERSPGRIRESEAGRVQTFAPFLQEASMSEQPKRGPLGAEQRDTPLGSGCAGIPPCADVVPVPEVVWQALLNVGISMLLSEHDDRPQGLLRVRPGSGPTAVAPAARTWGPDGPGRSEGRRLG